MKHDLSVGLIGLKQPTLRNPWKVCQRSLVSLIPLRRVERDIATYSRSDGVAVIVSNEYLLATNPVLLIKYYEQKLWPIAQSIVFDA
ncbi:hypothetical protein L6164_000222 [Bauhinia variegata]|uniref:Uncharacterized protein n=1 Tax=Bauhinia variegata TaxID=167791 RepID=A0ACB9QBF6_BAUVA|nr:hypothetical protein L6164_000222 [Bauhinia variegata]